MPKQRTFEQWERQAEAQPRKRRANQCPCSARGVEHERWCPEYRRLGANGAWRVADERARALGGKR